jgi:hypothetical protein
MQNGAGRIRKNGCDANCSDDCRSIGSDLKQCPERYHTTEVACTRTSP